MAYEDIAPDSGALVALELNGNFNNTGYHTPVSTTLPTAGTYTFANEHPFDNTKQSLQATTTANGGTLTINLANSGQNVASTHRGTLELWVKYTAATSGAIATANGFTGFKYYDTTYGDGVLLMSAGMVGGSSYAASGVGHLNLSARSGSSSTSRTTSYKYSPNQWHCLHMEVRAEQASGTNRMYIYVDGLLDNTTGSSFVYPTVGTQSFNITLPTLSFAGQTFNLAEVRYFPTALTKEQKVLRAKYGTATIGYEPTVLADTPKILLKMDNATKTDPVTIYGSDAAAWGGELVTGTVTGKGQINYGSQLTVDQPGPKGDKAWKYNVNGSGSGWIANVTAGKMQDLWRDTTKNVTFEWMATSPSYDSAVATNAGANILRFNPAAGNGRLTVAMPAITASPTTTSIGQHLPTAIEYWSTGSSTWVTGSLSNLGGDIQANNQTNYSQHADNQWHHHVLMFDRSTTNLKVYYYIDGWLSRWRDFGTGTNVQYTAGSSWATLVAWFFGPDNSPANTARTVSFDNFAVYDKLLTNEQIRQHYYAYAAAEPVAAGVVKAWDGSAWVDSTAQYVWNGTNWVDWNASYYDGTQWVTI